MTKRAISRHTMVAVLAVVAVMLVTGGTAFASNTGFKFNMPLTLIGAGQIGHNWMSIPYFNPYPTAEDFCIQTGLSTANSTILTIDTNGAPDVCACGFCGTKVIPAGQGFRITTDGPTSIIVVGSHNPSQSIFVPQAGLPGRTAAQDNPWFSVPYHTTATNGDQLCAQIGLTSGLSGLLTIDPVTGSPDSTVCGFSPSTIVLGRSVRIRHPGTSSITFIPAHF